MSESEPTPPVEPKEEIPAFKFSPKKVDDGWKEEARKEREAAALARSSAAAKSDAITAKSAAAGGASPAANAATAAAGGAAPAAGAAGVEGGPAAPAVKPQSPLEQQQTKIFLNFVDGLAQQALMQMGELENPYTGQAEMDLQGARYTIELLATILAKTQGNLSETEHAALTHVLHDLKAHFATIAQEMQRQVAAQALQKGAMRPGPGGR